MTVRIGLSKVPIDSHRFGRKPAQKSSTKVRLNSFQAAKYCILLRQCPTVGGLSETGLPVTSRSAANPLQLQFTGYRQVLSSFYAISAKCSHGCSFGVICAVRVCKKVRPAVRLNSQNKWEQTATMTGIGCGHALMEDTSKDDPTSLISQEKRPAGNRPLLHNKERQPCHGSILRTNSF